MWLKIRIHILLISFILVWGLAARAVAQDGLIAPFSGQDELKVALWQLAAFVPGGPSLHRTLEVEGVRGLPPVKIDLSFAAPLSAWPKSLTLRFEAEESGSTPVIFTITDQRPFGGPKLNLEGLNRRGESRPPEVILLDVINGLNRRLMAGRQKLGNIKWQVVAPGFEVGRAQLLYGVRLGSADLFLARFDPQLYAFRPYHESEYPAKPQVDIQGWFQRLGKSVALINGGQYYPDRSYMGALARQGQPLSSKAHDQWKGYVVSVPAPGAPAGAPLAAIIDQNHPGLLEPKHYLNFFQSYMLLDEKGVIRVRNSYNLAGRTAIGQDRQGRLIFIMTPGAISLYDMALALKSSRLDLLRVMGLDGGFEAQLLLKENDRPLLKGGHFSITSDQAIYLPGFYKSLPVIVAVEPL